MLRLYFPGRYRIKCTFGAWFLLKLSGLMPGSTHGPRQETLTAKPADLLFTNARVLTLEAGHPRAQAVAVRGETIVAVGTEADVASLAGPGTRTIDCQGMTLLPG